MKRISIAGILLIVLGALALAYQGITYTHREKVIDIGPIHATADREKTIPLPPILGGIALLGGVGLLVAGAKTHGLTEVFGQGQLQKFSSNSPPAQGAI